MKAQGRFYPSVHTDWRGDRGMRVHVAAHATPQFDLRHSRQCAAHTGIKAEEKARSMFRTFASNAFSCSVAEVRT